MSDSNRSHVTYQCYLGEYAERDTPLPFHTVEDSVAIALGRADRVDGRKPRPMAELLAEVKQMMGGGA